jgi:hypothetical protein
MRWLCLVLVLLAPVQVNAQAPSAPSGSYEWELWKYSDPNGSENFRTTQDPGWWQRTWIGWDRNGDGRYLDGERGLLLLAVDILMSAFGAIGKYMIDFALSTLPQNWKQDSSPLVGMVTIANNWVPLDYMLGLASAYYLVTITWLSIRKVASMIPFLGIGG